MARPVAVCDCETDGLLNELTRVHLVTIAVKGEAPLAFRRNDEEDTIEAGLRHIQDLVLQGYRIVWHNGVDFDYWAIRKVYPWWDVPRDPDVLFDTLVFARLKFPDTWDFDKKLMKHGKLPKNLGGRHSLEAWGYRLGQMKGEYAGDPRIEDEKERKANKWAAWNPEMEAYAIQDVIVGLALYERLDPDTYPWEAIELEHRTRWIVTRQERFGVCFNEEKAEALYALLAGKRAALDTQIRLTTAPMFWRDGTVPFTPKRDNKQQGYTRDAPFSKVKLQEFNPSSRRHIARLFRQKYGWISEEFTEGGDPKIDETVLSKLDFVEAKALAELFLLDKRIGQLSEGDNAWLKKVRNGRIHGRVNTNGAVTGRMTHMDPNLGQVPKVGTLYGKECRELFGPPPGMVQVGADASSLEGRNLGHYLARYDGGAFAKAVIEGKEDDGTDIHSINSVALGFNPQQLYTILGKQQKGRNVGKTWFYAWMYGCGDAKSGSIVGKGPQYGKKLKAAFLKKTPAIEKLIKDIQAAVKKNGSLRGLDGRILKVRSAHAALNTLLQSAGAVVMKKALVILDDALQANGWVPGVDYEFMLNVHDEFQIASLPEIANDVARIAVESIRLAGEHFKFRCPLDGASKVGRNWSETH